MTVTVTRPYRPFMSKSTSTPADEPAEGLNPRATRATRSASGRRRSLPSPRPPTGANCSVPGASSSCCPEPGGLTVRGLAVRRLVRPGEAINVRPPAAHVGRVWGVLRCLTGLLTAVLGARRTYGAWLEAAAPHASTASATRLGRSSHGRGATTGTPAARACAASHRPYSTLTRARWRCGPASGSRRR